MPEVKLMEHSFSLAQTAVKGSRVCPKFSLLDLHSKASVLKEIWTHTSCRGFCVLFQPREQQPRKYTFHLMILNNLHSVVQPESFHSMSTSLFRHIYSCIIPASLYAFTSVCISWACTCLQPKRHFSPPWYKGLWQSVTHPHKSSFLHGVQQTDPQMFSFVVHGDHVKCYCFWHSQNDGQYPDQCYLNSHPLWNADPLDTTPWGHGAIPGRSNMCSQLCNIWTVEGAVWSLG